MTSGEFDSIIAFYNRIFMQSLKTFIMQFANSRVTLFLEFTSVLNLMF